MDETLAQGLTLLSEKNAGAARFLAGPAGSRAAELLDRYVREIELFNPAYGLVSVADRRELVVKHILDSLAPLGVLVQALENQTPGRPPRIADAGSGAGLPGIPLAIALPHVSVTLIERMGRRVGFLRNVAAALGLQNVEIEQTDVEKARPGDYALLTFRAFRPLEPPLLKALFRLLAPGGLLAAYKAREEKIAAEMAPITALTAGWEVLDTPVPFLDEARRLVLITPRGEP